MTDLGRDCRCCGEALSPTPERLKPPAVRRVEAPSALALCPPSPVWDAP